MEWEQMDIPAVKDIIQGWHVVLGLSKVCEAAASMSRRVQ